MIKIKQKGNFENLDKFLKKSLKIIKIDNIVPIAEECMQKLKEATPKDSGLTADSWSYEITNTQYKKILTIYNSNVVNGVNIAFVIDVGHISNGGHWVEGKDYIEPEVLGAFNKILNNTWKELKGL